MIRDHQTMGQSDGEKLITLDELPTSACWALAVTLEKVEVDGWKTTITRLQMLGSRFCESEDEAVGWFLRECMAQNEGFKAGQVLTHRIHWPHCEEGES